MAGRALARLGLAVVVSLGLCSCSVLPSPGSDGQPVAPGHLATPDLTSPSPGATPASVRVAVLTSSSPSTSGPGAFRYHVEYPQLEGDTAQLRALNSVMEGTIQRDLAAFQDTARTGPSGADVSQLTCKSATERVGLKLAVLRVDCSEFQAGAAHPSTSTHTFNCDLSRGRVLRLQDLFTQGAQYLTVLSEASRQQLRAKLESQDDRTLADGTAPVVDNFKDFLLKKDALVIVFAKYQVASPSAGQPEVEVSYGDLERYFAPGIKELAAS